MAQKTKAKRAQAKRQQKRGNARNAEKRSPKLRSMPKPPEKEHIHVAVPTINNYVTASLSGFISELVRLSADPRIPYIFTCDTLVGLFPVSFARNVCVGRFLKIGASRLWFIDADMIPTTDSVRLLSVDADICAGRMFRFDHANIESETSVGVALCAFHNDPDGTGKFYPIVPQEGDQMVQEVDALGTGSMLIRRKVLEDRRLWGETKYTGIDGKEHDLDDEKDTPRWGPPVFGFPSKPNGCPQLGEDMDFCRRAKALGYTLKVDLGAKFGHYKPVDLDQVVDLSCVALERHKEGQRAEVPKIPSWVRNAIKNVQKSEESAA
jgi:hypothetical protein